MNKTPPFRILMLLAPLAIIVFVITLRSANAALVGYDIEFAGSGDLTGMFSVDEQDEENSLNNPDTPIPIIEFMISTPDAGGIRWDETDNILLGPSVTLNSLFPHIELVVSDAQSPAFLDMGFQFPSYFGDLGQAPPDPPILIDGLYTFTRKQNQPNPVPIPAAVWLFSSGLLALVGLSRRMKAT